MDCDGHPREIRIGCPARDSGFAFDRLARRLENRSLIGILRLVNAREHQLGQRGGLFAFALTNLEWTASQPREPDSGPLAALSGRTQERPKRDGRRIAEVRSALHAMRTPTVQ